MDSTRPADGTAASLENAIRQGIYEIGLFTADVAASDLGFKGEDRSFYTFLTGGVAPIMPSRWWVAGAGAGTQVSVGRLYFDLGGILRLVRPERSSTIDDDKIGLMLTAQALIGLRFADCGAIFVGPTLNLYRAAFETGNDPFVPVYANHLAGRGYWWPGFVTGLQL